MKIQFVASELAPLAQTGGLGDAVAGLANALATRGHEVSVVMPAYPRALEHVDASGFARHAGPALPAGPSHWWRGSLDSGVSVHLLDVPGLYAEDALYLGSEDDVTRFAALSRGAALLALDERPDVVVAHDWQAALVPALLRTLFSAGPGRTIASIQVVHNNAHQGRFPAGAMERTGLPQELFQPDGVEFFGDLCLLKAGLVFADRIVTVSPHYAEEIQSPEQGGGLDGLYRSRAHRLIGIANGIDTERYDPATDPALPEPFSAGDINGRAACRAALLRELELDEQAPGPRLALVGRFAHQKGWDVVAEALPDLVANGTTVAMLGDGDPGIRALLQREASRHPGQVHLTVGWNEPLSRRLYAGADAVLIPSRFEPCGLVQLLSQRYGCLPVAHAVGGLCDTIRDGVSGVLFAPLTRSELVAAVARARELLERRGAAQLARELAALDVSWSGPAGRWEVSLRAAMEEARARA